MRLSLSNRGKAILVDVLLIIGVLMCLIGFAYCLATLITPEPAPLPRT